MQNPGPDSVEAPAFCDRCAAVFPSGIISEGRSTQSIAGQNAGPCPVCGGEGHVPGGVFEFLDSAIEMLSAPEVSEADQRILASILTEACGKQSGIDEIRAKIDAEVPALLPVCGVIPDSPTGLYAFLTLIVAVVSLLLAGEQEQDQSSPLTAERALAHLIGLTASAASRPVSRFQRRIRRNDPCSCGSGKRFKQCCGRLTGTRSESAG